MKKKVSFIVLGRYKGRAHWEEIDSSLTPVSKAVLDEIYALDAGGRQILVQLRVIKRIVIEEEYIPE